VSEGLRLERALRSAAEGGSALVLDGGLATELERRGHDLRHPLWSAKLMLEDPGSIVAVHRAYLEAGADCVVAASYQASVPGFVRAGLAESEAVEMLRRSVELTVEACRDYEATAGRRPFAAASVGPYGAFLADGSEYSGDYEVGGDTLRSFHAPRWEILASASTLLACETLPSLFEAEVLLDLLEATPEVRAWMSFSCRDGAHLNDGTPIAEAAARCAASPGVVAVGVNCTAPRFIPSLILEVRRGAPALPVVVYPNSGETWDAEARSWLGVAEPLDFAGAAREWRGLGATLIGGCCRTTPEHVAALRAAL
jgi:homocysteine S-methyltransferase